MSSHLMQLLGNFVIRTTICCCQSSLKRCTKKNCNKQKAEAVLKLFLTLRRLKYWSQEAPAEEETWQVREAVGWTNKKVTRGTGAMLDICVVTRYLERKACCNNEAVGGVQNDQIT
ncbi:hypothetical protein Tco_0839412 [Tanacetum coccineum]|uniref:Secreted protein n=1 Tax=Tanacetum coccineum TaxID=301880 RepID=A0ABQ5AR76_9ASTR